MAIILYKEDILDTLKYLSESDLKELSSAVRKQTYATYDNKMYMKKLGDVNEFLENKKHLFFNKPYKLYMFDGKVNTYDNKHNDDENTFYELLTTSFEDPDMAVKIKNIIKTHRLKNSVKIQKFILSDKTNIVPTIVQPGVSNVKTDAKNIKKSTIWFIFDELINGWYEKHIMGEYFSGLIAHGCDYNKIAHSVEYNVEINKTVPHIVQMSCSITF